MTRPFDVADIGWDRLNVALERGASGHLRVRGHQRQRVAQLVGDHVDQLVLQIVGAHEPVALGLGFGAHGDQVGGFAHDEQQCK